jgi:hypothetical protein
MLKTKTIHFDVLPAGNKESFYSAILAEEF